MILIKRIKHIKNRYITKIRFRNAGRNTVVLKPKQIENPENIFLGDNVFINIDARIETITHWVINGLLKPKITIGNRTTFQQRLHLVCANSISIGNDCVFSANIFISDNNHSYQKINENIMNQELEINSIIIGDYSFIGYGACLLAGTKLGRNCIVGSNSVLSKEYPDYSVIAGNPAKIIKYYDMNKKKWIKDE